VGDTYVITEACIGVKDATCVDVCPAACIHTTPEAPQYYIDPDVCIACEQCVLVCPVNAIFLDDEVPAHLQEYLEINAAFFRDNKPEAEPLSPDQARAILAATVRYAEEAGYAIAVAVVDGDGDLIESEMMPATGQELAQPALDKAYTAAKLQGSSAKGLLRSGAATLWLTKTPLSVRSESRVHPARRPTCSAVRRVSPLSGLATSQGRLAGKFGADLVST
jgi:ferredoxin